MRFHIITLFPEFFAGPLSSALMQRARDAGIVAFQMHNPRDRAEDLHRSVDDRPYGGGPGMVMLPGPLAAVLRSLGFGPRGQKQPGRLILLSPGGAPFSQALARELASGQKSGQESSADDAPLPARPPDITLLCGRYEGLDARIEEYFPVESVSLGDFVLNGGESAALCLIEAVARLLPGYMGHEESGADESFSGGLLEHPHYTRPENFEGMAVPAVLRSGDHARIALWRRRASLAQTLRSRPQLLTDAPLTADDREFLRKLPLSRAGRNLYCALVHYPVLDKAQNSVAVSLTNLDIHDIARSSCTYGLGGYYVLTPLTDQRALLATILDHWTKGAGKRNPDRDAALALVHAGSVIHDAVTDIMEKTGQEPLIVGTSASAPAEADTVGMSFAQIGAALSERPVLLLLGTGYGLAPEARLTCHVFAPPLRWHGAYNHLSVRSAAAILFDRILGDWR